MRYDLSDGAETILRVARRLNFTSEGDIIRANLINPEFATLRDAHAAIDELVDMGLVVSKENGAIQLTGEGASAVLMTSS